MPAGGTTQVLSGRLEARSFGFYFNVLSGRRTQEDTIADLRGGGGGR